MVGPKLVRLASRSTTYILSLWGTIMLLTAAATTLAFNFLSGLGPGFLYIDRAQFRDVFAKDVSAREASVMAATQKPIIGSAFGESVDQQAWKTIPS